MLSLSQETLKESVNIKETWEFQKLEYIKIIYEKINKNRWYNRKVWSNFSSGLWTNLCLDEI